HTPDWIREKTRYLGGFSRYDDRTESVAECRQALNLPPTARIATVVNGSGGGAQEVSHWQAIARACPHWTFLLVGQVPVMEELPPNLKRVGFVDDTFPYLRAADVVVGSGGTNTMMEVGAARRPFLSMPEPRPFDEQVCKMKALERLQLTRVVETDLPPAKWPDILESTAGLDTGGWELIFAQTGTDDILA
ncbi:MAG: glycosyltransferase, partial [Lewinella sp.]